MTKERSAGDIIRELKVGGFASLRKIEHGGTLQARRLSTSAIQLYWRFTYNGKTDRVVVGIYDSTAPPQSLAAGPKGYSLAAAAEACRRMATIHSEAGSTGGYREHVATLQRSLEAAKAAEVQEGECTLSKLMGAYCDYLESKGRRSHADARSIFRLHVSEAYPKVARGPASALTSKHVNDMLRRLGDMGKGRTGNKLRAYLRAAYQCALDVDSLSSIPASFKVETALAAAGISRDDRGHLQSHGQSGVQARHYDDYDYFKEKLEALKTLHSLLESPAPKRAATSSRALRD